MVPVIGHWVPSSTGDHISYTWYFAPPPTFCILGGERNVIVNHKVNSYRIGELALQAPHQRVPRSHFKPCGWQIHSTSKRERSKMELRRHTMTGAISCRTVRTNRIFLNFNTRWFIPHMQGKSWIPQYKYNTRDIHISFMPHKQGKSWRQHCNTRDIQISSKGRVGGHSAIQETFTSEAREELKATVQYKRHSHLKQGKSWRAQCNTRDIHLRS